MSYTVPDSGSDPTSPAEVWSAAAKGWDDNAVEADGFTAGVTDALVAALAIPRGGNLLELAAGPGTLGPTWSELVGPEGSVELSDIAPAMVEVATRRSRGITNIATSVLDAGSIDRPDAHYDVVVCRMGLMFVPEPAQALSEIRRVLTPGGRLGALTWGGLGDNPWMTCVGMAVAAHGLISELPVGPGGPFSLSDPEQLAALAEGAGFVDVVVDSRQLSFHSTDVASHLARVLALAGPLGAVVNAATEEQRAAVLSTASELAAPYATAEGVTLPGQALSLVATTPL